RPPSEPGGAAGRRPAPRRERADPLKSFIDSLTDRYEQKVAMPARDIPLEPEGFSPPPRHRRREPVQKKSSIKPPPAIQIPSTIVEDISEKPASRSNLHFSDNPIIQGIIFSEILGTPRGLNGGNRLPSDS
ncbi:MAG: hypothetical protein U9N73_07025, partial [Candidatus Auribacterota bacterium]|nr:hypothetical protein [Candidatus Auribacterota bacterium]